MLFKSSTVDTRYKINSKNILDKLIKLAILNAIENGLMGEGQNKILKIEWKTEYQKQIMLEKANEINPQTIFVCLLLLLYHWYWHGNFI